MALRRREIGPAEEGRSIGEQEDGHRPPAGAGHSLDRAHVDLLEIGSLLAVDLDADEESVHQLGRRRVLERFAGHDVAPVAGAVADAQEDGTVLGPRPFQRIRAPGVPVDRVGGVFEEVGARLCCQPVGHRPTLRLALRGSAGWTPQWSGRPPAA